MQYLLFLILAILSSCSCGNQSRNGHLRIGVDPTWAPLDFGAMQPYVNGYTEDVLLEIARYSGLEFEKVNANWSNLLEGMKAGQYEAVLTSIAPYEFNLAKYDFTSDFLLTGPVLITPTKSSISSLKKLSHEQVGIITGDSAALVAEKYPEVIIRSYSSIPELLDAVASGEIAAALLNRLPAVSYVNDLYQGQLKIASKPLTNQGLHLIAPKGRFEPLIRAFDKSISQLEKKETLNQLQKKWNLSGN